MTHAHTNADSESYNALIPHAVPARTHRQCIYIHIQGMTGVKASCLLLMGSSGIKLSCTTVPQEGERKRLREEGEAECEENGSHGSTYFEVESWEF